MRRLWTRSGHCRHEAAGLRIVPDGYLLWLQADIWLKRKRKLSAIRVIGPPQTLR
jgi:hypothetical protein